ALHAGLAALYEGHGYELVTCPCEDFNGCEFCAMNPIPPSLGGTGGIPRLAAQFLLHYPCDPPINDKDPRTRSRGIEILQTYVEKYKREMFEVEAVEVPFELPFYSEECFRDIEGIECGYKKHDGWHNNIGTASDHEFTPKLLFT